MASRPPAVCLAALPLAPESVLFCLLLARRLSPMTMPPPPPPPPPLPCEGEADAEDGALSSKDSSPSP